MRTDLELLKILLDKLNSANYFTGLCYIVSFNSELRTIESVRLLDIIEQNRPTHAVDSGYFWPVGEKAPRRVFLETLISKLEAQS